MNIQQPQDQQALPIIADQLEDGVVLTDETGRVRLWNRAQERITGRKRQVVIDQPLWKVYRNDLSSPQAVERFQSLIQETLSTGHSQLTNQPFETEIQFSNGQRRFIQAIFLPLQTSAGYQIGMITRDLTSNRDLLQQAHLNDTALVAAANGIAITDPQGRILWVNPAFSQFTGYSQAEVIGETFRLLKSGKQDAAFYQQMWSTISSGNVWRGELINRRKDGSLYYEEQTITPVLDEKGEISHYIAIMHDITSRKERDLELEGMVAVANALRTAQNRAEMLPAVLDETMKFLNARGAAMALPDRITGDLVFELATGNMANWTGVSIPKGEGISGLVLATGKPYVNDDVTSDPRLMMSELLDEPHAVACVPLIADGQPIAALWAARDNPFGNPELNLLNAVADMSANAIHRASLHEQTELRLQRLAALHAIDKAISSSLDLSVTLGVLLDQVIWQLGVDAADVLLYNPHLETLEYAARRGFNSFLVSHTRLRLDEGCAGQSIQSRQIVQIPNLPESKDRFARAGLLAGEGFISYFAVPLIAKDQVKGVLDIFHRTQLNPDREWMDFLEALAKQAAIAIDNALLFRDLQRTTDEIAQAYDTTLEGWVRTLGLRDGETEDHTQRVTEMTLRLASALDIGPVELDYIRRGALLHDIGKMGIPDSILLKPGPLTPDEREIIRRHPTYAYELLEPIAYLRPALDIPYCHHEKWDGSGYPRQLKGEEIPLAARLFAVADVWDALTSNRPYRSAWAADKAGRYLRAQAGKHFDPRVIEVFFDAGLAE